MTDPKKAAHISLMQAWYTPFLLTVFEFQRSPEQLFDIACQMGQEYSGKGSTYTGDAVLASGNLANTKQARSVHLTAAVSRSLKQHTDG